MPLCHTPIDTPVLTISPSDIDTSQHFWNAFDHSETEVSANWIVQLCQSRESWAPFTREDIEQLYSRRHKDGFRFNKLLDDWIVTRDGMYYVTAGFVIRCFESSPNKG